MSTRGTYTFKSDFTSTTLYNHWDNYPAGAATHLHKMLVEYGTVTAEAFIRANEGATLVSNGASMGQEYHYEFSGETISAYPVNLDTDELGECFFTGSVYEFINQYGKEFELEEWFQIESPERYTKGQKWTCKPHLKQWINSLTETLSDYMVSTTIDNVNVVSTKEKLDKLTKVYSERFKVNSLNLREELKAA